MFHKNIEALRPINPDLADKLEKIDIESITDIIVVEAESKDLIIGYKELALHSTFDPIREANAIWNKSVKSILNKNDIQILFGLGLGYLFKRAYINSDSKIMVLEPIIEILRFVLEHVDLSTELADTRVYLTDNTEDLVNKLKQEYLKGDKAEFLILPAYAQLEQNSLENLTSKIVNVMEEKSSDVNTIFRLAHYWTENFIKSLPNFFEFRPLGFFRDAFADKTALIIAAGPSLAENIDKIRKNRDKFVTIAVGKAAKVLAVNDIIPDFVTFADARSTKFQIEGIENQLENTNVIMTSKTDSIIATLKPKNKILYLSETDIFTKLFTKNSSLDPGCFPSASSISIINYFIAKAMGFRTIVFVGLDLAFPDNKIYATGETLKLDEDGCMQMEGIKKSFKKIETVRDKEGNEIKTRDDYLLFIRQLEDILAEDTSLSTVINTSLKGAYIKGMDYLDFDDFLEKLEEQKINSDEVLSEIFQDTDKTWSECMEKVSAEVYSNLTSIKEIKEKSSLMLDEIRKQLTVMQNETGIKPDYNRLNELKNNLNKARTAIMHNMLLQYSLQGELWLYTKDYKTENMNGREVIINNLKVEERLFINSCKHSTQILDALEKSIQYKKELNRI